jgi:hypothetical protein
MFWEEWKVYLRRGNEEKDFSKEKGILRTCHVKPWMPNFASWARHFSPLLSNCPSHFHSFFGSENPTQSSSLQQDEARAVVLYGSSASWRYRGIRDNMARQSWGLSRHKPLEGVLFPKSPPWLPRSGPGPLPTYLWFWTRWVTTVYKICGLACIFGISSLSFFFLWFWRPNLITKDSSSAGRWCQLSFRYKFWYLQIPLLQDNQLPLDVSVRYRASYGE